MGTQRTLLTLNQSCLPTWFKIDISKRFANAADLVIIVGARLKLTRSLLLNIIIFYFTLNRHPNTIKNTNKQEKRIQKTDTKVPLQKKTHIPPGV